MLLAASTWEPATPANRGSDLAAAFVGETEVLDRATGKTQKENKLKATTESVLLSVDTPCDVEVSPDQLWFSAVPQRFSEMFWFPGQIPDWVITLHLPTIPLAFSVDHDVPSFLT